MKSNSDVMDLLFSSSTDVLGWSSDVAVDLKHVGHLWHWPFFFRLQSDFILSPFALASLIVASIFAFCSERPAILFDIPVLLSCLAYK